ncbi:MAG: hypothetical protein NC041_02520 [Bacteroides sp.]|nr:hypothetical protein [Prevotella sp.]MCM1408511.1 hypothetical protein [Treponema brennaborense]MCM1469328.1 hypothetical protein [Bacteroides sp.]
MKTAKKIFLVSLLAFFCAVQIFAQEWDDDWGDDASSASGEESALGFWDTFKISGDASLGGRIYFDGESIGETEARAIPELELGLDYEGSSTNFSARINLSERTLLHNQIDILDEFRADLFLGGFVLSAGKMKTVWGKGDKLHVLDNFNANDYTDFLIPDYLDRRAGEYMFRVQYNAPSVFRLEGIYTPVMRGEVYAEDGRWVPNKVNTVTAQVLKTLDAQMKSLGDNMSASQLLQMTKIQDEMYPDTNRLKYGQFGLYGNFSVGAADIGVSYYNGHYKQVSANLSSALANGGIGMPSLEYDRLQVFGLDAQAAAGPFTLRAELAYNLTEDTAGDDPWIHNNSVSYLAGFDVGIPLHNLNLNVQGTGNFVLQKDKITDALTKTLDADYDPTGCYSNNKLVVQLKDTFYYEKVEAVVKAIYGFERKDFVLMPEVSYKIRDGWKARLSGLFIDNFGDDDDSEFAGWLDNSFIQLSMHYSF